MTNSLEPNVDFITPNLLKKDSSKALLQEMVRHPTCMIFSNQLGHTKDGWRDALCTPVLLGLLQGRLPGRLRPGRRARCQKLHCSPLISSVPCRSPTPPMRLRFLWTLFVATFCGSFLRQFFFTFFWTVNPLLPPKKLGSPPTSKKKVCQFWYQCYYPCCSRDAMSPVCKILLN